MADVAAFLVPLGTDIAVWGTATYKLDCYKGKGGDTALLISAILRIVTALMILIVPGGFTSKTSALPIILSVLCGLFINITGLVCVLQDLDFIKGGATKEGIDAFVANLKGTNDPLIEEIRTNMADGSIDKATAETRVLSVVDTTMKKWNNRLLQSPYPVSSPESVKFMTNIDNIVKKWNEKDPNLGTNTFVNKALTMLDDMYAEMKKLDETSGTTQAAKKKVNRGLADTYMKLYMSNIVIHIVALYLMTLKFTNHNYALNQVGTTQFVMFMLLIILALVQIAMLNSRVRFTSQVDNRVMNGIAAAHILIISVILLNMSTRK